MKWQILAVGTFTLAAYYAAQSFLGETPGKLDCNSSVSSSSTRLQNNYTSKEDTTGRVAVQSPSVEDAKEPSGSSGVESNAAERIIIQGRDPLTAEDARFLNMVRALLMRDAPIVWPDALSEADYQTLQQIIKRYWDEREPKATRRSQILNVKVADLLKRGAYELYDLKNEKRSTRKLIEPQVIGQLVSYTIEWKNNREWFKVVRINPGDIPESDALDAQIKDLERLAAVDAASFLSRVPRSR